MAKPERSEMLSMLEELAECWLNTETLEPETKCMYDHHEFCQQHYGYKPCFVPRLADLLKRERNG